MVGTNTHTAKSMGNSDATMVPNDSESLVYSTSQPREHNDK